MRTYHGPKDRVDAARSLDTPSEELAMLAKSGVVFVREAVAENPNTPGPVLRKMLPSELSTEEDFRIAKSIASNPIARADFLREICELLAEAFSDINPRDYHANCLIEAVAVGPGFNPEWAEKLLDPEVCPKHIRGRIASPGTNRVLLVKLLDDPSENVSSRARRSLDTKE